MCDDAAGVLREAGEDGCTASDAWEDQQSVNDSIAISPSETIERDLADDSRADEFTAAVAEVVEGRSERPDA